MGSTFLYCPWEHRVCQPKRLTIKNLQRTIVQQSYGSIICSTGGWSSLLMWMYRYLTKDQLKSKSSIEAYIKAFQRGCKCVERKRHCSKSNTLHVNDNMFTNWQLASLMFLFIADGFTEHSYCSGIWVSGSGKCGWIINPPSVVTWLAVYTTVKTAHLERENDIMAA